MVEIKGRPLSELGLENAVIVTARGSIIPFEGFMVQNGQTIHDAIQASLPDGATLYVSREAAENACKHDWIEHFSPHGPTHQMCLKCGKEERFPAYVLKNVPESLAPTAFQESAKKQTSSAGRWWGRSVIYGKEDEANTAYMTRYWIGRLRLHVFHRGDQDPDCHDHPWDFWTFPLTSYVEEILLPNRFEGGYDRIRQIVPAFRWSFRSAEHTHRVISRARRANGPAKGGVKYNGVWYVNDRRPIVTIVWRSKDRRAWGFLKNRDGKWCWIGWRDYVFGGGKSAPCE